MVLKAFGHSPIQPHKVVMGENWTASVCPLRALGEGKGREWKKSTYSKFQGRPWKRWGRERFTLLSFLWSTCSTATDHWSCDWWGAKIFCNHYVQKNGHKTFFQTPSSEDTSVITVFVVIFDAQRELWFTACPENVTWHVWTRVNLLPFWKSVDFVFGDCGIKVGLVEPLNKLHAA